MVFIVLALLAQVVLPEGSPLAAAAQAEETSGKTRAKDYEYLFDLSLEELMNMKVVSATRSAKGLSETAENITVISAEEIELMNAHTLADVLNTVTGVGHDFLTYPGGVFLTSIQGSKFEHVLAVIDGVVLNNLFELWAYMGAIPVQNIQKIEIVKVRRHRRGAPLSEGSST